MKEFGKVVALKRGQLKMSQEHLAKLVGVTRVTVANVEAGTYEISLLNAAKFAVVLDFSLDRVAKNSLTMKTSWESP